jgi:hypothetical protein
MLLKKLVLICVSLLFFRSVEQLPAVSFSDNSRPLSVKEQVHDNVHKQLCKGSPIIFKKKHKPRGTEVFTAQIGGTVYLPHAYFISYLITPNGTAYISTRYFKSPRAPPVT